MPMYLSYKLLLLLPLYTIGMFFFRGGSYVSTEQDMFIAAAQGILVPDRCPCMAIRFLFLVLLSACFYARIHRATAQQMRW